MNHISPKKYIEHGSIIQNINRNERFDCIVYDVFDNKELTIESSIPLFTLANGDSLAHIIEGNKRILFIITKTGLQDYISDINKNSLANKKMCIVSTDTGVTSSVGKGWRDMNDESKAKELGFSVADPFDFVSILSYFSKDSKTYIRIQNGEYPNKLLEGESTFEAEGGTHSLEKIGISGPYGTIVTMGRHTHDVLSSLLKLQEEGILYDAFISESLAFTINDNLRNSILRTEKIVVLYNGSNEYAKNIIQSKLFESGLTDAEVLVLTPDLVDHRSIQPEYIYHEAGFGVENFMAELQGN